ncbi:MAG: S8 family serine peptidase, partial [Blastocatellia bacterium]|nr:S8 family serine peptidase [Blastocatellia bacterium]
NELIVRWKDEYVWEADRTGFDQQFASFNAQAECNVVGEQRYTDHDLTQTLEFDAVKYSVLDQLLLYQANEMVDYVQPNYLYDLQSVPNDPFYNTYQKVYPLGKISAEPAWDSTTGSDTGSVIIAVLDTGANVASTNGHIAHPDFTANLWSGQNIGTDKHNFTENGHAVTDVYDYESDGSPRFGQSHGSNVASIIGARGNNGLYMCGLSQKVRLMILKVLPVPPSNISINGKTSIIVDAVNYAVAQGARAMNMSFGQYFCTSWHYDLDEERFVCDVDGFGLDPALLTALDNARTNDVVAVCAAGNSGANNDAAFPGPYGPANMPVDNVISVAASDASDNRATFLTGSSNYGSKTVDLAAPGKGIWGLRQNFNGVGTDLANYSQLEGTSQAAPHVTGTIALVAAKYGWESYYGLRDRVLMGTDSLGSSWTNTNVRTKGRLNAHKALQPRTLIRNISTRARVESGDKIMIGGFIISDTTNGTGRLKVAIRGIGPSLQGLSVAKLANPKITLKNSSGGTIYSNNDWGTLPTLQKNDLDSNDLTPLDPLEAAMVCAGSGGATGCDALAPGVYSVWLESSTGSSFGVGRFELYELENGLDQQTRLVNVSTRCLVRTGDEQAIAGVIVGDVPSGPTPTPTPSPAPPNRSLLMLGKGPSLPVSGKLANPKLTLNGSGGVIASNDNWPNLIAPLDELEYQNWVSPTWTLESALWPAVSWGTYTVIMNGVSNGTGIGSIEIYEY